MSSVRASARQPPTAASRSRRTTIPLPRNSEHPPSAQRARWISPSRVCSSAWAPAKSAARRVEDPPSGGHRPGAGRNVSAEGRQEARPDPGVGVEDDHHLAPANPGRGGGQGGSLAVGQVLALASDHPHDIADPGAGRRVSDRRPRPVHRPVVNDDQLEPGRAVRIAKVLGGHVADERGQDAGLVPGGHDDAEGRRPGPRSSWDPGLPPRHGRDRRPSRGRHQRDDVARRQRRGEGDEPERPPATSRPEPDRQAAAKDAEPDRSPGGRRRVSHRTRRPPAPPAGG